MYISWVWSETYGMFGEIQEVGTPKHYLEAFLETTTT